MSRGTANPDPVRAIPLRQQMEVEAQVAAKVPIASQGGDANLRAGRDPGSLGFEFLSPVANSTYDVSARSAWQPVKTCLVQLTVCRSNR